MESALPAGFLLGGSASPTYLHRTLDALETTLPRVRGVELPGVGHLAPDNTGEPERVAGELRRFFGPENIAWIARAVGVPALDVASFSTALTAAD